MNQRTALDTIADCFEAIDETRITGENPLKAFRRAAGAGASRDDVIAKRLCSSADMELGIYFSLPSSQRIINNQPDIEQVIWSLLDVINSFRGSGGYATPSKVEVSMLRMISQSITSASNASHTLTDESFSTLRAELQQIEQELGDPANDSDYIKAIRVQVRHLRAELDRMPVDSDAIISKAAALIGMLAICAKNSQGPEQKKFIKFLKRTLGAIGFGAFTGAGGDILGDAVMGAIEGAFTTDVVAPDVNNVDDHDLPVA
ncbi:hypothetical protein AUR04nite_00150 [Glutamicibacter uratoxydans]|uniref:Uncharacterized protein n=1 Tax=Glutamicibacter uratoxydans TaxID=43667 RepID=A0A4Y4DIW7_GLUUR|nr:hypothetical protein [Glutamicibacter uratoxydans]GED04483.1 hypothetical protein AUR04nite_00150 [Glutamicibacter uratoxydans]